MDIDDFQKKIINFRDKRNWKQFHNPKDLAVSLLLEAAELIEHFQWKSEQEIQQHVKSEKAQELKEEVVDVLWYVLLIAHELNMDLEKEFLRKLRKNEKKYPVEKSKGSHKKYTEL